MSHIPAANGYPARSCDAGRAFADVLAIFPFFTTKRTGPVWPAHQRTLIEEPMGAGGWNR
jgi:hypothetical protein